MEIVGAVASIATLVAVAKEVSELTIKLSSSLCDAPRQFAQLKNHTCLVFLALQSLNDICVKASLQDILSEREIWILNQALTTAKHEITAINKECSKLCGDRCTTKRKLRWSLMEKSKSEEYLQQLQRIESSLGTILQSTNLKVALRTSLSLRDTLERTSTATRKNVFQGGESTIHSSSTSQQSSLLLEKFDPKARRSITGAFRLNAFWMSLLNCYFVLVHHTEGSQKTYHCQARLSVPTFTGRMALMIMVSLRQCHSRWQEFDLLGGRLRFVSYASEKVVSACRNGDVLTVRDMIVNNKAAPTDVSREGNSLLWYAAQSGSAELVSYLLEGGAAVLPNLLLFAAHWRRPDLARICFRNKVDANFTGCDGMTAPMFLYSTGRKPEAQTEFLDIIACNSFTEINCQDSHGWTILHRAAAFGTREDIKAVLALNLATHIETYHLEWTALFCAVCHNNQDTMEELWSAYDNPHQMTDLRGWNLLHVAAGAGNFEVVDYLIQHGVSLDATSNATSLCVPPGLEDRRLTPSDVARVYGEESYRIWSSTLEACGRTANPRFESIDWSITEDEPHIAYGGCECCDDWGF